MSGSRFAAASKNSRTCLGFAIPVVSPNAISSQPAATRRSAMSNTCCGSTSPSYGQPNETEMTPSARSPSPRARPTTASSPLRDSSTERFTFFWLCVSVADRKQLISWKRSRSASAFSSPRSLGIRTLTDTSSGMSARLSTSVPSASCGITSGRTKLVASSRRTPVRASASTSRTLSSVAMTSGSFWKPSRGPTSRIRTASLTCRRLRDERFGQRLTNRQDGVEPRDLEDPLEVRRADDDHVRVGAQDLLRAHQRSQTRRVHEWRLAHVDDQAQLDVSRRLFDGLAKVVSRFEIYVPVDGDQLRLIVDRFLDRTKTPR